MTRSTDASPAIEPTPDRTASASHWRSLSTRLSLSTVMLVLVGMGLLGWHAGRTLKQDTEALLGQQQLSTASLLAAQLNQALAERIQALEVHATAQGADSARAGPATAAALQARLDANPELRALFTGGLWVSGVGGSVVASTLPALLGRNYADRDYVIAILKGEKFAVGKPVIGKVMQDPVFAMAVPVRDAQGRVVGVLAGVTDLSKPGFLDLVAGSRYGQTGGYLLVAWQHRLIITATDKRLAMSLAPPPGASALVDRFMAGYEGPGILVNALGIEMLSAARRLDLAPWYVAVAMPTAEAFAPLREMQRRIAVGTLGLGLLAALLVAWLTRRQLAPLRAAALALAAPQGPHEAQQPLPLPPGRDDEVVALIKGFNQVLAELARREALLRANEQGLATTLDSIGDAVIATDLAGRITRMNPTAARLTGWPLAEAQGRPLTEVFRIVSALTGLPADHPVQRVLEHGKVVGLPKPHHPAGARRSAVPDRRQRRAHSQRRRRHRRRGAGVQRREREVPGRGGVGPDPRVVGAHRCAGRGRRLASRPADHEAELDAADLPHRRDRAAARARARRGHGPVCARSAGCHVSRGASRHGQRHAVRPGGALDQRQGPAKLGACAGPGRTARWQGGRLYGTLLDITERRQAEQALRESEMRLSLVISGGDIGFWDWDLRSGALVVNERWCDMLGLDPTGLTPDIEVWNSRVHPDDSPKLVRMFEKVMLDPAGDSGEVEVRARHQAGHWVWILDRFSVVGRDADGAPLRAVGTHVDITERKHAQEALLASEARARAIIDASPVPMALNDRAGNITFLNPAFTQTFGYALAEIPTLADWWPRAYPDPVYRQQVAASWAAELARSARTETQFTPMELTIRARDGTDRFVLVGAAALADALEGSHLVVLHDITGRHIAELALQASLAEKTALLKEVHHRVKNNLQVVSSLLRLEAGRSGHAPTQAVLADMQGRIRAMALLHESIYRSGTLASIDLGNYIRQVATQAFRSLQTSGAAARPQLRLELGSVQAGLDQATPCGLLLTELVSNALKHGFPAGDGGAGGEVVVALQPVPGGAADLWCLRVSDNGVGLPAGFAGRQQDSLGLQLVASLALQLGGSLEVGAVAGAGAAAAAPVGRALPSRLPSSPRRRWCSRPSLGLAHHPCLPCNPHAQPRNTTRLKSRARHRRRRAGASCSAPCSGWLPASSACRACWWPSACGCCASRRSRTAAN